MLLAGNGYLSKPAANFMTAATLLQGLSTETDLSKGVFSGVDTDNAGVSSLIADAANAAMAEPASVMAGQEIAAQASLKIKKTLLELVDPILSWFSGCWFK